MSPVDYLKTAPIPAVRDGRICARCLLFWAALALALGVGIWAWRANHE